MYEGTLRENLDPMGVTSQDSLKEILKQGQDLVKNGENTSDENQGGNHEKVFDPNLHVEKNGANISSGERQIINFLRVISQKAEIVFLDEATSNIDPNTGN